MDSYCRITGNQYCVLSYLQAHNNNDVEGDEAQCVLFRVYRSSSKMFQLQTHAETCIRMWYVRKHGRSENVQEKENQ